MNWTPWIVALSSGGLITALVSAAYFFPTIRKMRSETSRVDVDAALAVEGAEDKHLTDIIRTQAEFIVEPLRQRITDLEAQVEKLERTQRKYHRLLDWTRQVLTWSRGWHADADPPLPTLPSEVQEDL